MGAIWIDSKSFEAFGQFQLWLAGRNLLDRLRLDFLLDFAFPLGWTGQTPKQDTGRNRQDTGLSATECDRRGAGLVDGLPIHPPDGPWDKRPMIFCDFLDSVPHVFLEGGRFYLAFLKERRKVFFT